MSPRSQVLSATLLFGALLLAPGVPGTARAEVGAAYDPGMGTTGVLPVLAAWPPEDPDPVPWLRYSPIGSPRVVLNDQGTVNGDGIPSIAVDLVSGWTLVAWARNSSSGFDVVLSRFQNGSWTDPEVLAGTPANELDPSLVIEPDGTVHLLYWVDGPTPRVMHRQAPADLSAWSDPVQVSADGELASRPTGVVYRGVLHVAYEVDDYGVGTAPRDIVVARSSGSGFSPEIVAVTNNTGPVRPEIHSANDRLWLDWIDADGEMAWTRLDSQGQWEPTQYEPFSTVEQRELFVRGTIRFKAAFGP